MIKKLSSEFIATLSLVFFGTGAIVIDSLTNGSIGHLGISISFGLIVLSMIYAFGETSGAHCNPAVTLGFAIAGRFPWKEVPLYILSQILGALGASLLLHTLFPQASTLGSTIPAFGISSACTFEILLTTVLMLVILKVSHGSKEIGTLAGIAIGATILLEALVGGPVSGASMNPARSIAPAMVSGNYESLWIYIFAPSIGACLASVIWKTVFEKRSE